MSITIVGAGLSGLLAGNMLRHRDPEILEAQKELPNNHSAVLRFRSPIVGDVLGIPFQKVTLIKCVDPWLNPIADALAYSKKNTNVLRSDRSIVAPGPIVENRWIAPPDLVSQMARRLSNEPRFNYTVDSSEFKLPISSNSTPMISTLPMPTLMNILGYADLIPQVPDFQYRSGNVIRARIKNCDAYVSMYVPNPNIPVSRISITGDELIVESTGSVCLSASARFFGIEPEDLYDIKISNQKYAKILPIQDKIRKDFMHWATDKYGIYSLGRYATWRPGLLLDDLVKDIQLIDKWIGDRYAVARHR